MNPYHDEKGRFASGESSVPKGTKVKFADSSAARLLRDSTMHVIQDLGPNVRVAISSLDEKTRVSPIYRKSELKVSGRDGGKSLLGRRQGAAESNQMYRDRIKRESIL